MDHLTPVDHLSHFLLVGKIPGPHNLKEEKLVLVTVPVLGQLDSRQKQHVMSTTDEKLLTSGQPGSRMRREETGR